MEPIGTPESLQQFNVELTSLLDASNPQSQLLLAFIRRSLWQHNLQDRYSVIDIFVEAYLRAVNQLYSSPDKVIQNPKAWIRGTALNVIREYARNQSRESQISMEITELSTQSLVDDSVVEENLDAIVRGFHRLSHYERKLLELKHLQGMTWKEVRDKLGGSDISLPALRKRGQRVLEKLRFEYHQIKPPVDRNYTESDRNYTDESTTENIETDIMSIFSAINEIDSSIEKKNSETKIIRKETRSILDSIEKELKELCGENY